MWPWNKKPTKAEREISAFKLFDEGRTDLEIAAQLKVSLEEISGFRKKYADAKNQRQVKLYEMFSQDKDFVTITKILNMSADDVATEYRSYLALKDKQEEIMKEHQSSFKSKERKFAPPFRVTKMVMNQMTGRKNTVEAYPVEFNEPPKTMHEFDDFTREYGDGVYIVVDSENRKVSQIPVSGKGFDDPMNNPNSPMYDPEMMVGGAFAQGRSRGRWGDEDDDYGYGRGRYNRFGLHGFRGRGRRGRGGIDDEAEDMLEMEERKRNVYLRAAELATRQGRPRDAERLLRMMDPDSLPAEKQSFLDELVNVKDDKGKMEVLKLLFGNKQDKEELTDQERTMKFATDHLIPSIKENLIEPIGEAFAGNVSADDQLKREVMQSQLGPGSGFRTGMDGGGWQKRRSIGVSPQAPPQQPPPQRRPALPQAPAAPPPRMPEDVEEEEDIEEEIDESIPADDYGQPIKNEDLQTAPAPAPAPAPLGKLSFEQSWLLKNRIPKFRAMIDAYVAAQNTADAEMIEAASPKKNASDDYYMMTKSTYARFIGKKRVLAVYHAAKRGPAGLIGDVAPYVQEQVKKYEETAKLIRQMGVDRFKEVWEPPEGISKRKALRLLGKYMTLKACWDTFQTAAGKAWLIAYCEEMSKCIEADVMKGADKKEKIKEALTPNPEAPAPAPAKPASKPAPKPAPAPAPAPVGNQMPMPPPPPGFAPPQAAPPALPQPAPPAPVATPPTPLVKTEVLGEEKKPVETKPIGVELDEILEELE
jgi:hypothetical protein